MHFMWTGPSDHLIRHDDWMATDSAPIGASDVHDLEAAPSYRLLQGLPHSLCVRMPIHLCIEDALHSGVTVMYGTRKTYTTNPDMRLTAHACAVQWTDSTSWQGPSRLPRKWLGRRHFY